MTVRFRVFHVGEGNRGGCRRLRIAGEEFSLRRGQGKSQKRTHFDIRHSADLSWQSAKFVRWVYPRARTLPRTRNPGSDHVMRSQTSLALRFLFREIRSVRVSSWISDGPVKFTATAVCQLDISDITTATRTCGSRVYRKVKRDLSHLYLYIKLRRDMAAFGNLPRRGREEKYVPHGSQGGSHWRVKETKSFKSRERRKRTRKVLPLVLEICSAFVWKLQPRDLARSLAKRFEERQNYLPIYDSPSRELVPLCVRT